MSRRGVLSNPEAQERRRARNKQREASLERDWRAVLQTPEGRRILNAIIRKSGFPIVGFQSDPRRQDYNAGKQEVGAWIASEAQIHAPSLYRLMQDERFRLKQVHEIERQADEAGEDPPQEPSAELREALR